jgi:hypothetical protein
MSKSVGSLLRVVVLGCAVLLLAACTSNPAPPAASDSTSGSTSTSAPAEDSGAKSGGSGGWLDGIPASVPPFTYGTLDSDQSSKAAVGDSTMYSMYYEGVTKENITEYLEKLKAAGFKIDLDSAVEAGNVSAAGELKKGDAKLMGLSISLQSGGHVDYTLNVSKAAE